MPISVYEPTVYTAETPVSDCCFFESLQSFSETAHSACPTCGHPVHRAVTACGTIRARESRTGASPHSTRNRIADGFKEKLQGMLGSDFVPSNRGRDEAESDSKSASASSASSTRAGRTARLIANHICTAFCRH